MLRWRWESEYRWFVAKYLLTGVALLHAIFRERRTLKPPYSALVDKITPKRKIG